MRNHLQEFKKIFINNKKIAENYFFMTLLLVLNSFFGLLIYPYLIRTLGAESYGVYIFASTVVNYFICFIGFGFDMYGVRLIAENPFSIKKKIKCFINYIYYKTVFRNCFYYIGCSCKFCFSHTKNLLLGVHSMFC